MIQGYIRDPHWYAEPTVDKINTSDPGLLVRIIENIARFLDWIIGHVENDYLSLWIRNLMLFNTYAKQGGLQTLLFDVEGDPRETTNIAEQHPEIVKDLLADVEKYKKDQPKAAPYWMITRTEDWSKTFIAGNFKHKVLKKRQINIILNQL